MCAGLNEQQVTEIEPWYKFHIESLPKSGGFDGLITFSSYITTQLLFFDDSIAPPPQHITCITGLLAAYDELIFWYRFQHSTKLKEVKSMTFLVPVGMSSQM
jgi:hypothetical protein